MSQEAAQRSGQSGPIVGRRKTANITPGAIGAGATVYVDFAFAGAAVGDLAVVTYNATLVAGIVAGAPIIAAADVVKLPFTNITSGSVTQTVLTAAVGLNKAT